jgi:uncharacterized protein YgiM (DUF1202 family)
MNIIITITSFLFLTLQVFGQDYKYVNTETLNIREGAGKEYNVIGQVNKNDKVNTLSQSESWTQIETETGLAGFVATKYLSSTADETKISDNIDSSWSSVLVVLGIIGYGLYKIKNFFSSLFDGGSSQRVLSKEQILKWFHCGLCGTLIKQSKTPINTNRSCLNKDYHKWEDLGKVGDLNYQCIRCGTVVQTAITPTNNTNWSCLGNDYHKWTKLS